MKSVFNDIHVCAKFYMSKAPDGKINPISRTLGKFSIVDRRFGGIVDHREIWLCKITGEIKPGQNHGAFILLPIKKIDPNNIRKLIPGFYDTTTVDGSLILSPNTEPADNWMLSIQTRKIFSKKYHAIIVPVAYTHESDGEPEGNQVVENCPNYNPVGNYAYTCPFCGCLHPQVLPEEPNG